MSESSKSKFPTMGNSAATTAKNASAEGTSGKLIAKKNTQAGDPTIKNKSNRSNVKADGKRGYGIKAKMPSYQDPHVGPTQGNGRLFSAAVNRTAPNFSAGYSNLD